jgi:hypothetical protein
MGFQAREVLDRRQLQTIFILIISYQEVTAKITVKEGKTPSPLPP